LKFVDYRFFPGSLGNYAGNERKIPIYTLELPTAYAAKSHDYWTIIRSALLNALNYKVYDEENRNPIFQSQQILFREADAKGGSFDSLQSPATSPADKSYLSKQGS
jgi:hypothetical protein